MPKKHRKSKGKAKAKPEKSIKFEEHGTRDLKTEMKLLSKEERIAKKPKILIATPAYGGSVLCDYMDSFVQTVLMLNQAQIPFGVFMPRHESLITRARNAAAAAFLGDLEYTHLLFIDADISWEPLSIMYLLDSDYDICGCPYPIKTHDFPRMLDRLKEPRNADITGDRLHHIAVQRFCVDFFDRLEVDIAREPEIDAAGFMKVEHIGTGFMMIKRKVFESIIEAKLVPKYTNDNRSYNSYPGAEDNFYDFFCTMVHKGRLLSEDYAFSKRAIACGYETWLHPKFKCTHTGGYRFESDLLSIYRFFPRDTDASHIFGKREESESKVDAE